MALTITVSHRYLGAKHGAAAMAELGFEVLGLDVVPRRSHAHAGEVPMYEPAWRISAPTTCWFEGFERPAFASR